MSQQIIHVTDSSFETDVLQARNPVLLDFWAHYTLDKTFDDVLGWETQNKLTVARLIALSALERTESIGVHYRSDATNDESTAPYHVTVTRNAGGTKPSRVAYGPSNR